MFQLKKRVLKREVLRKIDKNINSESYQGEVLHRF